MEWRPVFSVVEGDRTQVRVLFVTGCEKTFLTIALTVVGIAFSSCYGCGNRSAVEEAVPAGNDSLEPAALVDIADLVGLKFSREVDAPRSYFMPDIMGSGCAFFDFDNDGDLDVYLIQSGSDPAMISANEPRDTARNRLFSQQPDGSFADVTETSGLGDAGYGMGVAVGDVDNDGDLDVYVTNYGPDALYQNNGDGTFDDITVGAGINNPSWGTSACFLDYDNDGWLDLYVVNYVDYFRNLRCLTKKGTDDDFCAPLNFESTVDRLYRNLGDVDENEDSLSIRFGDVTDSSGIIIAAGTGLGVASADFNSDGRPDIYVANDMRPNFLWMSQPDGTFVDEALQRGCAYNRLGQEEAGMGVTVGDFDNDGDFDIFVTHNAQESHTLYVNQGDGFFEDGSVGAMLELSSTPWTGFGTQFIDMDHDGNLDLPIANGRVRRGEVRSEESAGAFWDPYLEPSSFFINDGAGKFVDRTEITGVLGERPNLCRGLAAGDIDRDGDIDLLISKGIGAPYLFRNDLAKAGEWLSVSAVLPELSRAAIGAVVEVMTDIGVFKRIVQRGGSYASAHDARCHFGLGISRRVERIAVVWPGGRRETFPGCEMGQHIVLSRGQGLSDIDPLE